MIYMLLMKTGNIINIFKKIPMTGTKRPDGYLKCKVKKHGDKNRKTFLVHRSVWECHNGLIPDGKVIDHINDKKDDNRICNLQLMTPQENSKKSAKGRDFSYVAEIRQNSKNIKSVNQTTNEVL